jgi:hypothetical protein
MVEEVGSPDCLPPEKPAAVPLAVLDGHEDCSRFGGKEVQCTARRVQGLEADNELGVQRLLAKPGC